MADKLADDLLDGAAEIAEFVLGDRRKKRRIYHMAAAGQIPVFRFGDKLQARRSTILAHVREQEAKALAVAGAAA